MDAAPTPPARFEATFTAARSADCAELSAGCGWFEAGPAEERRFAGLQPAGSEKEVQSLEGLRRRHRGLPAREVFGVPDAGDVGGRRRERAVACEVYAERAFAAPDRMPRVHR